MENNGKDKRGKRYSDEVRERSIRLVVEHQHEYSSQSAAIAAIAPKIGCGADTLRKWVKQHEIDIGLEAGTTTADRERMKELEREVKQLRQANEILKKGEAIFCHWSEDNGRTHILLRRSSTARFANDRLRSRASR